MSKLEDLYQEMVIEHYSKPRNFRKLEEANRVAQGNNPFCGDKIILYLQVENDVISDVSFQGSGCAISRASTSMMTESIKGKSSAEAKDIFEDFHQMLTRGTDGEFDSERLGDLELLAGVSEFPTRIKCAILSWHTLKAALKGQEGTVKTE